MTLDDDLLSPAAVPAAASITTSEYHSFGLSSTEVGRPSAKMASSFEGRIIVQGTSDGPSGTTKTSSPVRPYAAVRAAAQGGGTATDAPPSTKPKRRLRGLAAAPKKRSSTGADLVKFQHPQVPVSPPQLRRRSSRARGISALDGEAGRRRSSSSVFLAVRGGGDDAGHMSPAGLGDAPDTDGGEGRVGTTVEDGATGIRTGRGSGGGGSDGNGAPSGSDRLAHFAVFMTILLGVLQILKQLFGPSLVTLQSVRVLLAASLLSISLASSSLPNHLLALVARKRLRASTVDKAGQGTGQDGINMPMSDASSGNIISADTATLAENIPRIMRARTNSGLDLRNKETAASRGSTSGSDGGDAIYSDLSFERILSSLEADKRAAVEAEEYGQAQLLKDKIDQLKRESEGRRPDGSGGGNGYNGDGKDVGVGVLGGDGSGYSGAAVAAAFTSGEFDEKSDSIGTTDTVVDPRFIGRWKKDKARSENADEILKVLGVPWAVRVAIRSSPQENSIELDGTLWAETTKNSVVSNIQMVYLDRSEQENVNPMDKSTSTMVSFVDPTSGAVVSESDFPKQQLRQVLTRTVENEGAVYHVENRMTLVASGKVLVANSYFDRILT